MREKLREYFVRHSEVIPLLMEAEVDKKKLFAHSAELGREVEGLRVYGKISVEDKNLREVGEKVKLHVFKLNEEVEPALEMTDEAEGESSVAFQQILLPSRQLDSLWDSLLFDDNSLKSNLLKYVETSLLFSDRNVNSSLISWNNVVLLHGPPGTGEHHLLSFKKV